MVAAPVALLAIRLRGGGISTLRVGWWFAAVFAALGGIGLMAVTHRAPLAFPAGGVVGAVGGSLAALAYGMIAGLPWRVPPVDGGAEAAAASHLPA